MYENSLNRSHKTNSWKINPLTRLVLAAVEKKGVLFLLRVTYNSRKEVYDQLDMTISLMTVRKTTKEVKVQWEIVEAI